MTSTPRCFTHLARLACLCSLALAACSSKPANLSDGGDGGGFLLACTSQLDAGTDPNCAVPVSPAPPDGGGFGAAGDGGCLRVYIGQPGEKVWLSLALPKPLPPQGLLEVLAGVDAPSTPLQLAVNILESNQATSVAAKVDDHTTGAPKPLTFLLGVAADAGSPYYLELSDNTGTHFDVHNPVLVCASVFTSPDMNLGTVPINLGGAVASVQTGTCQDGGPCTGVLTVAGSQDVFSVTIPSNVTRPILYLDLSAPSTMLSPPPLYRLGYELYVGNAVTANPLYQDHVANNFLDVNLSAALLVTAGQTYTIAVNGYTGDGSPAPGDLRLVYSLTTEVMPDQDVNEPNDLFSQATPWTPSSVGESKSFTGRLAYMGDDDWYVAVIPPTGMATRLHYKITPLKSGGRYPPVGQSDRVIEVGFLVTDDGGFSAADACQFDPTICPQDPEYANQTPPSTQSQLVDSLCTGGASDAGALCLASSRQEFPAAGFANLVNFEGIIPIPPQSTPYSYLIDYKSLGGTFCDDLDYTLQLDWEAEGLENQSGYHRDLTNPLSYGTLSSGSFPNPPNGVSGTITTGYGLLQFYDLTELPPIDVRSPADYDAIPSTEDTWEVDFPANAAASFPNGATWELNWTLNGASGVPAEGLLLWVQFCDGTQSLSHCQVVSGPGGPTSPTGATTNPFPGAFGYDPHAYKPWYNPNGNYTGGEFGALYGDTGSGGAFDITAQPVGCFCFENRFLQYGKFYITVVGADRTAWTDSNYTLNMGLTGYPQAFTLDGGTWFCPAFDGGVPPDAGSPAQLGCAFTQ